MSHPRNARAMRGTSAPPAVDPARLRLWPRFLGAAGLLLAVASVSPRVGASDDKIVSTQLFEDATALAKQGNYHAACPKLEESLRLDFQIGTLFWLADCQEHVGKLASAWANFLDAAEKATIAGKPTHAKEAKGRADALKGRLSKMVLVVSEEVSRAPGLEIRRDGKLIGTPQFGVAVPIDGGKHEIIVSARGKRAWRSTIEIAGEGNTFTVTVPMLPEEAQLVVAPRASAAPFALPGGEAGPLPLTGQRVSALVIAGIGGLGLGLGAAFGVETMSKTAAAKPLCEADLTFCTSAGVQLHQEARTTAAISNVAFGVGVAAAALGVVLWVTAPKARAEQASPKIVRARLTALGLVLEGGF